MFKQLTFRSDGAFWPLTERGETAEVPKSGGRLAVILSAPRRLVAIALHEIKARHAAQSLASLDDRMLRDIGIARSEIESVCRQGREALKRSSDLRADFVRWS